MSGDDPRPTWDERLVPILEATEYATRVVARMPRDTAAQERARAAKWMAIMHEWRESQLRWFVTTA